MKNLTAVKVIGAMLLLAGVSSLPLYPQIDTGVPPSTAVIDPLLEGKQDLARQDWAAARGWFATYLTDHPESVGATLLAGNAALGLKQFEEARGFYAHVLLISPETWSAHANLAIIDAATERWAEFDEERRIIRSARDRNAAGLSPKGDVIDILWLADERYTVRDYYQLEGHFHTRYNVLHYSPDRKLDFSDRVRVGRRRSEGLCGEASKRGGCRAAQLLLRLLLLEFARFYHPGFD